MNRKIIVALDVDSRDKALALVNSLYDNVGGFKIGLEMFTALGPSIVNDIQSSNGKVFLDLKFHDIPNTIFGAVTSALKLGVWMMTLHCAGGLEMLQAARNAIDTLAAESDNPKSILLGVTLLTSINQSILTNDLGIPDSTDALVSRFALLAKKAGLDGVVCSGKEISFLKNKFQKELLLVVPGIRPEWSIPTHDQKRTMTPKQAIQAGADFLVIGRPITQSPDPKMAVQKIIDEISSI